MSVLAPARKKIGKNLFADDMVLRALHATLLQIRKFEEKVVELLYADEIKCPCHLYIGQEAVATGVCAALNKSDYVYSNYRSHGHYLAKGGNMNALMAELFGRSTGCSGGHGGSMHVVDAEVGILGTSAIVAGMIPIAVGTALAAKLQNNGRVVASFFGDGATDEGAFYEAINFASLKKLPVVFVCENNLYSTHLPLFLRQPADNIYKRVKLFKIPAVRLDGNDVVKVYEESCKAVEHARSGKGPYFMECRTYRWRAHVGPWPDIDVGFRTKKEVNKWIRRCPVKFLEKILSEKKLLTKSEMEAVHHRVEEAILASVAFSKQSPLPDPSTVTRHLYRSP